MNSFMVLTGHSFMTYDRIDKNNASVFSIEKGFIFS